MSLDIASIWFCVPWFTLGWFCQGNKMMRMISMWMIPMEVCDYPREAL